MPENQTSRRRFLLGAAGVVAAPVVAGCTSDEQASAAGRTFPPVAGTGVEAPMP